MEGLSIKLPASLPASHPHPLCSSVCYILNIADVEVLFNMMKVLVAVCFTHNAFSSSEIFQLLSIKDILQLE